MPLPDADWLGLCRRAAHAAREAVAGLTSTAERSVHARRGRGRRHDARGRQGGRGRRVRGARGVRRPAGGGLGGARRGGDRRRARPAARVVVDPVDGSVNAKRRPALRVRLDRGRVGRADGRRGGRLRRRAGARRATGGRSAARGRSATASGSLALEPGPLELLGLETARPERVAAASEALGSLGARRLRALGSVAASMCLVAGGRLDAMLTCARCARWTWPRRS